ncbi:MAG: copper homeostasis protein CutC [Lachnospirales bacterium]
MILEVCVDSYSSILTAKKAGANRIELCSALNLGGLTPSYGLMKKAKEVSNIEIFVMIRPRSGDFLYDEEDFETMLEDIEIAKEMNFHGIVIGFLLKDGTIDIERLKKVVQIARPLKVVFHRAFDNAKNPIKDVPKLIDLGICRILTSGQKTNALEGAEFIKELQEKYGNKITIMSGCGVNANNIEEIYNITKCTNYHLSGKINITSQMEYKKCEAKIDPLEFSVAKADYNQIKAARDVLNSIK